MIPSYKNKKVLIMGLGLHGGGLEAARFFYKKGAEILITDLKPADKLAESLEKLKSFKKIKYTLGKHEEKDFLWADLIIKNPDVPSSSPYLEIARKNNIKIETDVSLFFKLSKAFIIGITGTKGKSTTASLIYHIIKTKFPNALLGGNIGISPLALLSKVKPNTKVVLELSSFELEDLNQSPQIAVITNIMQDHLNRYGTMEEYIKAKKRIFQFQNKKNYLVVQNNSIMRQIVSNAISNVILFSEIEKPKEFKPLGKNNLLNLSAALKVAKILKIPEKNILKAIKTFKGVHSRQEFIREVNGVKYYNDTTATMPDAVISAIQAFKQNFPKSNLILICGGQNKNLEYKYLVNELIKNNITIVMLPGTGSDIIENLLGSKEINKVSSMQEAIQKATNLASPGDIIILSPGGASFNLFKNEFDRGDQFVKYVRQLKNNETTL
jgi:UDP-N-acetylmuramoylalanine--D-glutamate ligase